MKAVDNLLPFSFTLLHPHVNLSSTPLSMLCIPGPPPFSSLAISWLLLSTHFTDTPTETSDLSSGQEVKRVQVPPVRVIPHISVHLIQERGSLWDSGGVESWQETVSHYQTMPHHLCHRRAIDFDVSAPRTGEQSERRAKSRCPYFL